MKNDNPKRKIIKDRKLPSSEQINKHQNFDRLVSDHGAVQKIMIKKIVAWTGAVVCTAGLAGLVYMNSHKDVPINTVSETKTTEMREACLQPPIPGQEKPYAVYRISSKNGGTIKYETGSSLVIPANAFKSLNGEPVSDSIDIKYREFHDVLDIFLSGIPMEYDSAGVHRNLESAGMIDVRANDNGRELMLDKGKEIQVKMISYNNDAKFNLYELDTVSKNWVYKGKDKMEAPKRDMVRAMQKSAPRVEEKSDNEMKPAMADPSKFSFKINYDKTEFPELSAYENIMFEVTDNNFKPTFYKINWRKISLYSSEVPGQYVVKLIKADTTITVNAKPVFEKGNYEAALQKFEQQHSVSNKERDAKEFEEQKALNEVNNGLKGFKGQNMDNLTYRMFNISTTGLHNSDWPLPPILTFAYNIKKSNKQQEADGKKAGTSYNIIYLAEKGQNTVYRFKRNEAIRCNADKEHLMWTINAKGQVAFFNVPDFRKLAKGEETILDPVLAPNQDLAFTQIRTF